MTGGIRLGKLFGFEVRLDYSWFIIFFLVLWTFSASIFPQRHPNLSSLVYVVMGTAGALLFFVSVLLHELAHSAVARARGIEMAGITLFVFGGIAHSRMEAEEPKDEFLLTVVGPLSSVAIGLVFLAIDRLGAGAGLPTPITGVAAYLAFLNFILAGFNMVPGFPLDGGRIFRSIVWQITGDIRKATRWASRTGQGFGFVLIGLGILGFFAGNVIGGMWFVFIGWFLAGAAAASYRQLIVRRQLEQVNVRQAMTERPETVSPDLTLRDLVDNYLLQRRFSAFPVKRDGDVVGLITLSQVKEVDRDDWPSTRVEDVMQPLEDAAVVSPTDHLAEALSRMQQSGAGRVLVIENGDLVGLVTRSDVANWLEHYQQLR
ncbi:MAG: CBS domain-containing protein [Gemmatimonadetes bacterium]|uniref:Zinc metalloprotease n=1 Tax=Candidatus Kutchimonas denitrificans TaxID=3056748 RepID=A0AAE4Z884_9BACT|nr:CBS domain-containing protein [Gemmatimonadota bacterium]NIR74287.1 CBS domain-containing protein [Candidatus Kutchimonas denitrificans]NIS02542.1 CBS domain-containing protein [Gemmatimonadota bacterium]NIT68418.1 CBS domain-containing protein [Gemmatimonadota bacterium]NIU51870.1 CBS domain-containing protein [Gemmatimonadota bacterium]